jgi:protein ImuB
LRALLPPAAYEESAELDHPLKVREPLLFLIARFLHDLSARLLSQSLAAQAIRLTLNRQQRTLALPFPTRDTKLLLKLVEHSLERQPPEEPVQRVHLELLPTQPRRLQHGLFTHAAPEPEKLELTLGKIRGLVGEKNVGYPELFDTYRPGTGRPGARGSAGPQTDDAEPRPPGSGILPFRHFRPPLPAQVKIESGYPKHLYTKLFRGRVIQIAGPWRTNGDWWRPDAWDRDEFDLHTLYVAL